MQARKRLSALTGLVKVWNLAVSERHTRRKLRALQGQIMDAEHILNKVRQAIADVITAEARTLDLMADQLGPAHDKAVETLLAVEGRIILVGVGKSGHVARKIAATLASTGAPAQFVHPTEASHGDMGMITSSDAVIAISKSGETVEMNNIVTYTRRFAIPLIAITARADSTLGRQADIVLTLPDSPEACLIGKAPTTSTTATMALGDGLAVALMQARGFGPDDFHIYHPGGRLGAQLTKVGMLMHTGAAVPRVTPDMKMQDVLLEMTTKNLGLTAVVDRDHLTGIITDGDLRRNVDGLMHKQAGDIATSDPKTVPMDMLAAEALKFMQDSNISAVFVTSPSGALEGVLRIHDCLVAGVA